MAVCVEASRLSEIMPSSIEVELVERLERAKDRMSSHRVNL